VGIDPKEVNFVAYDGGGDLLPAILGGKVAFGGSGFGEFLDQVEAGEVRVLAISGAERVDAVDARTVKESGIDLEFTNWRGIVAPPEISDADKQALVNAIAKMHESQEWKEVLTKKPLDRHLPDRGRDQHLPDRADDGRGGRPHQAGPGVREAAAAARDDPAAGPARTRNLAEYGVCVFLTLAGIVVLVDALQFSNNRTCVDPPGPKPVPVFVGSLLIVLAIALAVAVSRGSQGEAEAGEDMDLGSRWTSRQGCSCWACSSPTSC
jgi:hypothetical protein